MTIPKTGSIYLGNRTSASSIRHEFWPAHASNIKVSEFYRKGPHVPDGTPNARIATRGTQKFSNYRGSTSVVGHLTDLGTCRMIRYNTQSYIRAASWNQFFQYWWVTKPNKGLHKEGYLNPPINPFAGTYPGPLITTLSASQMGQADGGGRTTIIEKIMGGYYATRAFNKYWQQFKPGDKLTVTISRPGETRSITIDCYKYWNDGGANTRTPIGWNEYKRTTALAANMMHRFNRNSAWFPFSVGMRDSFMQQVMAIQAVLAGQRWRGLPASFYKPQLPRWYQDHHITLLFVKA